MSLRINDTAPNFEADTTDGKINFHDWIGDGWAIMFSHPKDFTPVCTTELGYMAGIRDEFAKRNCKIIGISVDPVDAHQKWKADIAKATGNSVDYPMIGDPDLKVAKLFDMLGAKLMLTYPMTTGRNFDELLRVLDSIQLTAKHKVATPAGWKQGDDVIVVPAVSDEEAKKQHGDFKATLPYLRVVPQPKG